ncbi:MAG: DUF835 domain-containing protein [Euryarchaeota archaeon]|nr:DUF835 domain-containing protein [Euryarchaeota archaeon]
MTTVVHLPASGRVLLVDERKPDLSYRLLQERAKLGRRVLCITREPPERVARRYPIVSAEHYWLVTRGGGRAVNPLDLDGIFALVRAFLQRHPDAAVFIDGIELLMVMNSYEEVRDFLFRVQRLFREDGGAIIVPIDTRTLTVGELAEMKSSFSMLQGVPAA